MLDNIVPIEDINTSECVPVCENNPVSFWINDPQNSLSNLVWTVNGGTFSTSGSNGITVNFNASVASPVSVNLQAVNQQGETVTYSQCIQISNAPEANFEFIDNRSLYCSGDTQLINLSAAGDGSEIVSYLWHFDNDDTFSNAENPIHFFEEGFHTVTLTVTNECGCSDTYTFTQEFSHQDLPINCPTVICENEQATYDFPTDESCEVSRWSTRHGQIIGSNTDATVTVLWNNVPQDGFVELFTDTANCNCDYTKITRIPVITSTTSISGSQTVCPDSQILYTLPQWPTTLFEYTLTDASGSTLPNATIRTDQHNEVVFDTTGLEAGMYTLAATYDNTMLNCGGSASLTIEVKEVWDINGPETACINEQIQFTETNTSGQTRPSDLTRIYRNSQLIGSTNNLGSYTFSSPGIYELNNVSNPNECQADSYRIEILSPPDTTGLGIDAPDEICADVPITLSVVLPPDTGAVWSVTNGSIIGTANGASIQAIFNILPAGITDYEISVQLYALDAPDCLSVPFTVDVPPLTVNATILNNSPTPGNNLSFCTSSLANFSTDYLGAQRYDWRLTDPGAGSINQGQGTDTIDILWNELPNNVASQNLDLELNIIECGQIVATEYYPIRLLGVPEISITAPNEVCAEDVFTVTVISTNGLPINVTNATVTATLDGTIQTGVTASQGSNLNQFTVTGLTSSNVDNNQIRDLVITVTNLNGCTSTVQASSLLTINPTPNIVTFIQSGALSYCTAADIATIIETTTQTGSIGVTQYNWFRGNTVVQSGSNPILDIASLSNPGFGDYYVEAIGTNGCITIGETFTITQNCGNGNGNGSGGTGNGGLNPCGTSIANVTLDWLECDIIRATTPAGAGLTSFDWTTTGTGTITILPGATATQADFQVSGIGRYQITAIHNYGSCRDLARESIFIDYQAQLDLEATCNNNSGDFTVDLFNNSPHRFGLYPDQVTYEYSSNNGVTWNMITSGSVNAPAASITLPPGNYLFRMTISSPPDSPPCVDTQELNLQLPAGDFRILDKDGIDITNAATTCVECPVTLEIDTINPNFSYEWGWSSGRNLALNPSIILDENINQIRLIITNPSGCITTITKPISVNAADFNGAIQTSGNYCPDDAALTINYRPSLGSITPSNYEWLLNGQPAPGVNDQATYEVSSSGVYSVRLFDQDECSKLIDGINMIVNTLPFARIKVDEQACVNSLFEITGYVQLPDAQNITYRWEIDGQLFPILTAPDNGVISITHLPTSTGTLPISLTVIDAAGCETIISTSIEVVPAPVWEITSMELQDCDQYTVRLNVETGQAGTYYWSHGITGNDIDVNQGGPYRVRFVPSSGGCPIEFQFNVPKHPSEFLWIFPTGCIDLCLEDASNRTIIGPLGVHNSYSWELNGQVTSSGTLDFINPFELDTASGELQFLLTNGLFSPIQDWCTEVTDDLSIQLSEECEECPLELAVLEQSYNDSPYERYVFTIAIFNGANVSLNAQLTALNNAGVFNPSLINLPANSNTTVTLEFIPNSNFTGNLLDILITGSGNEGFKCISEHQIFIDVGENAKEKRRIILNPNPALEKAVILLDSSGDENITGNLVIYDIQGIMKYHYKLQPQDDSLSIPIDRWITGTYIVVWHHSDGSKVQKILIKK